MGEPRGVTRIGWGGAVTALVTSGLVVMMLVVKFGHDSEAVSRPALLAAGVEQLGFADHLRYSLVSRLGSLDQTDADVAIDVAARVLELRPSDDGEPAPVLLFDYAGATVYARDALVTEGSTAAWRVTGRAPTSARDPLVSLGDDPRDLLAVIGLASSVEVGATSTVGGEQLTEFEVEVDSDQLESVLFELGVLRPYEGVDRLEFTVAVTEAGQIRSIQLLNDAGATYLTRITDLHTGGPAIVGP